MKWLTDTTREQQQQKDLVTVLKYIDKKKFKNFTLFVLYSEWNTNLEANIS